MKPRTKALAAGGVLAGVGLGGVLWYYLSGSLKIPEDIQAFQKESEEKFKSAKHSNGEMPTNAVLDKMAEEYGLDEDDSVIVAFNDNNGMTNRATLLRALQPSDSADPFQRKFSTFTYYASPELSVMPSISFRGNAQVLSNSKNRIFVIMPDKAGVMRLVGVPPTAS